MQYEAAAAKARERLESGDLIPTDDDYQGAARLKIKSVEEIREDEEAKRMAAETDKGDS